MTRSRRFFASMLGVSFAMVAAPGPASAEPRYGNRESFWQGQLGVRSTFVTDRAFDPFATDNALTAVSLGVTRTLFDRDEISFASGIIWDYGERNATARGQATNFVANRLAVPLEGRYHFLPWMYGLVRMTPGAVHQSARLHDPLSPTPFGAQAWTFNLDASGGLAVLLGPHAESSGSPVRWWLAGEGGYSYAGAASLLMRPDVQSDDPRRTGDLDWGRLALAGGFFRIYGSVTY
jgi:hypothetical protein